MPPIILVTTLMGIGLGIIVGRQTTKKEPDHDHAFKKDFDKCVLFLGRHADKKATCEGEIRRLKRYYEKRIKSKPLNEKIAELYAMLNNNHFEI